MVTLSATHLHGLRVGAAKFSDIYAFAADLRAVELASGARIDVVLGQDGLSQFKVAVDLRGPAPWLEFLPVVDRLPSSYQTLKLLKEKTGGLVLDCSINGVSARAMIDLGSDVPLYVSAGWMERNAQSTTNGISRSASAGVEGMQIHKVGTLATLTFGRSRLTNLPAVIPDDWNHSYDVVIGLPVLARFDQIWNLRDSNLSVQEGGTDWDKAFPKDRSGIAALRLDDRLRIAYVSPGSPAEAVGLEVGDEIIAIDDEPLSATFFSKRPRPGAEAAGTREKLTLATGMTRYIVLRDYY